MDSSAVCHATSDRSLFDTFEPCGGSLLMENNAICEVAGIGSVKVSMFDGVVRVLGDV